MGFAHDSVLVEEDPSEHREIVVEVWKLLLNKSDRFNCLISDPFIEGPVVNYWAGNEGQSDQVGGIGMEAIAEQVNGHHDLANSVDAVKC